MGRSGDGKRNILLGWPYCCAQSLRSVACPRCFLQVPTLIDWIIKPFDFLFSAANAVWLSQLQTDYHLSVDLGHFAALVN